MDDSVRAFYDDLAEEYHLLFADWRSSIEYQAGVLDPLIEGMLGSGPHAILDCACGIGTQAIGLALRGHQVHATDLSPAAVARGEREAAAFGASVTWGVADVRALPTAVAGAFDIVLAGDNALPHLLREEDLRQAVAGMAAKLRPGGLFLVSIRDYDRLVQVPPRGDGPRVFDDPNGRRITFQVWDWAADGRRYRLHQFLVRQTDGGWQTASFATEYRAILRSELETAVAAAGLVDGRWHEPDESGYYQPILTARHP